MPGIFQIFREAARPLFKRRAALPCKNLLESTNLRIHEVGSAVGIDNTTHFINLFKSLTGLTPQAYRDGYLSFRQIDV